MIDDGLARIVLPVRIASTVGLQYAFELIAEGQLPRPSIIYVDAAHQYPETLREVAAAWPLLPPGGILIGDDYHWTWPGVVRTLDDFLTEYLPRRELEPPTTFACGWNRTLLSQLTTLPSESARGSAATVLLHWRQWILRKHHSSPPMTRGRMRPHAASNTFNVTWKRRTELSAYCRSGVGRGTRQRAIHGAG